MKEHSYCPGYVNYGEFASSRPSKNKCLVTWELKPSRDGTGLIFSMCAEIWQQNMRDILCGGQCVDTVAKLFPNDTKLQRMKAIWERWHLNGMRASCEHQRTLPEFQPDYVTLYEVGANWSAYNKLEKAAEKENSPEFKTLANLNAFKVKPFNRVYMDKERLDRFYGFLEKWMPGWKDTSIEVRTSQKSLLHIRPDEHPDGILCKPCPVCGYKYGTKWIMEELPEEVLAEIRSWETD